jgi:hypothetical protein
MSPQGFDDVHPGTSSSAGTTVRFVFMRRKITDYIWIT